MKKPIIGWQLGYSPLTVPAAWHDAVGYSWGISPLPSPLYGMLRHIWSISNSPVPSYGMLRYSWGISPLPVVEKNQADTRVQLGYLPLTLSV